MDFHRAVLDEIGRIQEREARRRWAELQDAVAGERALVAGLSARLAAVANERHAPIPGRSAGDPCWRPAGPSAASWESRSARPASAPTTTGRTGESLDEIARAIGLPCPPGHAAPDWAERSGANRCWPSSPTRTNRPVALLPVETRKGRFASAGYDLYDPVADRRRPVDEASRRAGRARPPGCSTGPSPIIPSGCWTCSASACRGGSRGAAGRRCWPCSAGLLGLAVPIGVGRPGRSGDPRGRPSRHGIGTPASGMTLCLFLSGLAVPTGDPPGRRGPDPAADRGEDRAGGRPRRLGSPAPAAHPVLQRLLLGRPGPRAMGLSLIFKKVSGAVVTTLVTGLISSVQPGLHVLV